MGIRRQPLPKAPTTEALFWIFKPAHTLCWENCTRLADITPNLQVLTLPGHNSCGLGNLLFCIENDSHYVCKGSWTFLGRGRGLDEIVCKLYIISGFSKMNLSNAGWTWNLLPLSPIRNFTGEYHHHQSPCLLSALPLWRSVCNGPCKCSHEWILLKTF